MKADRLVLLSYVRDGKPRRGTGLCIGEHFILTADHCADGVDHQAVVDGQAYPAEVLVRTHQKQIDLAVLSAADLPSKSRLPCARINSVDLETVHGCRVAGYPAFKVVDAAVPTVVQVDGHVPTSEGADPFAQSGSPRRMILKVTTDSARDIPVLSGSIDQPKSLWAGMSGAVIFSADDDHVLGVVCGHVPRQGIGVLAFTPLGEIDRLRSGVDKWWSLLGVPNSAKPPLLPPRKVGAPGAAQWVGQVLAPPPNNVEREVVSRVERVLAEETGPMMITLTGMRGTDSTLRCSTISALSASSQ